MPEEVGSYVTITAELYYIYFGQCCLQRCEDHKKFQYKVARDNDRMVRLYRKSREENY